MDPRGDQPVQTASILIVDKKYFVLLIFIREKAKMKGCLIGARLIA
jgi:hypothetical protein